MTLELLKDLYDEKDLDRIAQMCEDILYQAMAENAYLAESNGKEWIIEEEDLEEWAQMLHEILAFVRKELGWTADQAVDWVPKLFTKASWGEDWKAEVSSNERHREAERAGDGGS